MACYIECSAVMLTSWQCVAECPLPPLSVLLENPRIKETDSFVICVQMHSPVGPFYPQQPSAYYVPRDLLEGLEASLDNPSVYTSLIIRETCDLTSHRYR